MTAGRRTVLLALLVPCIVLCGCRRNDLVESELRKKETILRETQVELKRIEAQNEALLRELARLRQDPVHGVPILPPEIASPLFGLNRVTLGRGTGGYDNDNLPGDEALQVVLEPRDGDDHVVKVPGSLHVTAIEINTQGLKTRSAGGAHPRAASADLEAGPAQHRLRGGPAVDRVSASRNRPGSGAIQACGWPLL